jgi:hypothetical protein
MAWRGAARHDRQQSDANLPGMHYAEEEEQGGEMMEKETKIWILLGLLIGVALLGVYIVLGIETGALQVRCIGNCQHQFNPSLGGNDTIARLCKARCG